MDRMFLRAGCSRYKESQNKVNPTRIKYINNRVHTGESVLHPVMRVPLTSRFVKWDHPVPDMAHMIMNLQKGSSGYPSGDSLLYGG